MKKHILLFVILILVLPAIALGECIEGDCRNGFGIYVFPEGGQYAGEFTGGEFTGTGLHVFADGNRYEGSFTNSIPHGFGVLTYADGSVYTGQFDRGVVNGKGTIEFANKSMYEGEFVGGIFDGTGTYTFNDNKSQYKGAFKKGVFHGKGTLYSDGQVYKGEFKEGEHFGKGTITYFDKSQEVGEWKKGKFVVLQRIEAPVAKKTTDSEFEDPFLQEDEEDIFKDFLDSEQAESGFNEDFFSPGEFDFGQPPEDIFAENNLETITDPEGIFTSEDLLKEPEDIFAQEPPVPGAVPEESLTENAQSVTDSPTEVR
jgi:hypothetical protein